MIGRERPLLICDLTQSYAASGGGGVTTYLREKQRYVLENTEHRLLQIVPGAEDRVEENGRHIWAEVAANPVRGSPNYRFILRTNAVRAILERYAPDVIESLCPWILPWTAIGYRRSRLGTALVAGWHTDFPNAHVYRVSQDLMGDTFARAMRKLSEGYAEVTYRAFDRVYVLEEKMRAELARYRIEHVDVLNLGVDTARFDPARRDPGYRARMGITADGPLLIYLGRVDNEKRIDDLVAMMRQLPPSLGASLVVYGSGKRLDALRDETMDLPIVWRGFCDDRGELATALASSDIYVSAMADETFGLSVIEAQASGLPVVGVASGAMPIRVPQGLGRLGPVGDAAAMAANVQAAWQDDPRAMGLRARAHVAERFSWDQTFDRLIGTVYASALQAAELRVATTNGVAKSERRALRKISA